MIEMELLEESKETENKVRWDADVEGVRFSIYIPKWRVPEPWPRIIQVAIGPQIETHIPPLTPSIVLHDPSIRMQPVVIHLRKDREHTRTIRYQPEGDPKTW